MFDSLNEVNDVSRVAEQMRAAFIVVVHEKSTLLEENIAK